MSTGQVVDTEVAREFMALALEKVERAALGDIAAELVDKSARFRALLTPARLPGLQSSELRRLLRAVFATRRQADALLDRVGPAELQAQIGALLYGEAELAERFQAFVDALSGYWGDVRLSRDDQARGHADLPEAMLCDLAAELLHFTRPDDRWLWTRWMWDPRAGTGALPLVVEELYDLHGRTAGETYLKVGVAVAFVRATGEAAGFARFGPGPFGVDVFLACVYAVYMYTTLRLRMTQEFNRVVPQLPELARRLLGVWRLEL
ncbi:MAG: hypothetical protein IT317_14305 [Anaerolineales bacterium]|nr:hypothetical protein [Anaerolineales bacterium]